MNTISASGRLTRDAELRFTNSGKAVLGYTLASDTGFGDRKSTIFFNCSDWRKPAEALAPHMVKGLPVTVFGELTIEEYDAKDGTTKTQPRINIDRVELQGSSKPQQEQQGFRDNSPPAQPQPAPVQQQEEFTNDDIPF